MINYIDIPYRTTAVGDASVVGWSEDIASGRSDADVFMLESSIRFRVPPITNAKAVAVLAQLAPLMLRISNGAVRRSDGGVSAGHDPDLNAGELCWSKKMAVIDGHGCTHGDDLVRTECRLGQA